MDIKAWIKGQMHIGTVYLTENLCYQIGDKIDRLDGMMIHSTGANNPKLSRYVGPDDGQIGKPSPYNWNQPEPGGRRVCPHGFIGYLADGTVAIRQTLPWLTEGWHGGGKSNQHYIGVEICEDSMDVNSLKSWKYLRDAYKQAALLFAYLCHRYNKDPRRDGVIICHCEGHRRGIASNHADVMHWWPRFGVDMDTFRRDVTLLWQGTALAGVQIPDRLLPKPEPTPVPTKPTDKNKEDTMTDKEFAIMMDRYLAQRSAELAAKDPTMPDLVKDAIEMGITDGTRPMSMASRQEAAVMCRKVQTNMVEQLPALVAKELQTLLVDSGMVAEERSDPDGDYPTIDLPEEV